MKTVSITKARRAFGTFIDAVQREPIIVRRRKCDVAVVLSMAEFDRLRGQHGNELQSLMRDVSRRAANRGLTEQELAEILAQR